MDSAGFRDGIQEFSGRKKLDAVSPRGRRSVRQETVPCGRLEMYTPMSWSVSGNTARPHLAQEFTE